MLYSESQAFIQKYNTENVFMFVNVYIPGFMIWVHFVGPYISGLFFTT